MDRVFHVQLTRGVLCIAIRGDFLSVKPGGAVFLSLRGDAASRKKETVRQAGIGRYRQV